MRKKNDLHFMNNTVIKNALFLGLADQRIHVLVRVGYKSELRVSVYITFLV